MPKQKGNDNAKIAGLLVAVVAVIGFTGFRVLGGSSKPAAQESNVEIIGGPPVASTGASTDKLSPRVAAMTLSSINPFGPNIQDPAPREPRGGQGTPISYEPRGRNGGDTLTEMPEPEIGNGSVEPAKIALDAKLEGLIVGDEPLAIVSIGSDMHYLSKGVSGASGLKLEQLNGNRATLSLGDRKFHVVVGDKFSLGG